MGLADLTHAGVLAAIDEFDRVGRESFLRSTGFRRAHAYFLEHASLLYDSKAIAGFAHGVLSDCKRRHSRRALLFR